MNPDPNGRARRASRGSSVLDLIQLSRRPLVPSGAVALYRPIFRLTAMRAGDEVLVVPAGLAVTLESSSTSATSWGQASDLLLFGGASDAES